jgi:pteridine reductase
MISLAGRGGLIVGTRRVGAVVAKRLAAEGTNLAIAYRKSKDEAERLRQEILPLVDHSCLIQGDLTNENDVQRMLITAKKQLRDLSFIINLASDYFHTPFQHLDAHSWKRSMATAEGSFILAVHAMRQMMSNQGPTRGHVIFFGDWAAGETPYRDFLPYLTAKSAIHFMTRAFAKEVADHGILVNCIAPGPTMRPSNLSQEAWEKQIIPRTALRRESSPNDIAEVIIALLRSETITGEIIRVDAGRHLVGPGIEE